MALWHTSIVIHTHTHAHVTGRIVAVSKTKSLDEHIRRASLASVFLDTRLYNAHTLAVDMLWFIYIYVCIYLVYMYICVYVCVCACECMHIYICAHLYMCTSNLCLCTHAFIMRTPLPSTCSGLYIGMYVYIWFIYMCMCVCVCACECMHLYIYVHTYICMH